MLTRINTSVYPKGIDTDLNIPHVIDDVTEVMAINFNTIRDSILAIEKSLGTNIAGAYDSLADRLDAMETSFSGSYLSSTGDTLDGIMRVKGAKLIFGDNCDCYIGLFDHLSSSGSFVSPSLSTAWVPTQAESLNGDVLSVVPLSIVGKSMINNASSIRSRYVRIFDDLQVANSLMTRGYLRASNVDISTDISYNLVGIARLEDDFVSRGARKSFLFGKKVPFSESYPLSMIDGAYLNYNYQTSYPPSRGVMITEPYPVLPFELSKGNCSIDGDLEIGGTLHARDYMRVIGAQTAVNIDDLSLTIPAFKEKTNLLYVTFSAIILDVTANNPSGGINLAINGQKIEWPMIKKTKSLDSDDTWDDILASYSDEIISDVDVTYVEDGETITRTKSDRLVISPNGSYSAMNACVIVSGTETAGTNGSRCFATFNPSIDNVITMQATDGVSCIMPTIVVWACGSDKNVKGVSSWTNDLPVYESWTPAM